MPGRKQGREGGKKGKRKDGRDKRREGGREEKDIRASVPFVYKEVVRLFRLEMHSLLQFLSIFLNENNYS